MKWILIQHARGRMAKKRGEGARMVPLEDVELTRLTRLMVACLRERLKGVEVNGSFEHRVPGQLNLSFAAVPGERLHLSIRPVAEVSTGSACAMGKSSPGPGLMALGLGAERADGAVRISLGRETSEDEVHLAMGAIVPAVERIGREGRSRAP